MQLGIGEIGHKWGLTDPNPMYSLSVIHYHL